jgi:hypothetical protein
MNHPWLQDYPIKAKSKYLILGTHPPMPYCGNLRFFYGNMSEFWRFLDLVYPCNNLYMDGCPQLDDILTFLDKNRIAISDIVYTTSSIKFSIDSEMGKLNDSNLNPFLADWIKKSDVDVIYFTSFGGSNSAKSLFKKWYKKEFKKPSKISNDHTNKIKIDEREITLIDLFSPSPTARRSAGKVKEYRNWLLENGNERDYDSFRIYWYKLHLPKFKKN